MMHAGQACVGARARVRLAPQRLLLLLLLLLLHASTARATALNATTSTEVWGSGSQTDIVSFSDIQNLTRAHGLLSALLQDGEQGQHALQETPPWHEEVNLVTDSMAYHQLEFNDVHLLRGQGVSVDVVVRQRPSFTRATKRVQGGGGIVFGDRMFVLENTKFNFQAVVRQRHGEVSLVFGRFIISRRCFGSGCLGTIGRMRQVVRCVLLHVRMHLNWHAYDESCQLNIRRSAATSFVESGGWCWHVRVHVFSRLRACVRAYLHDCMIVGRTCRCGAAMCAGLHGTGGVAARRGQDVRSKCAGMSGTVPADTKLRDFRVRCMHALHVPYTHGVV